jgi:hypothetical protein
MIAPSPVYRSDGTSPPAVTAAWKDGLQQRRHESAKPRKISTFSLGTAIAL